MAEQRPRVSDEQLLAFKGLYNADDQNITLQAFRDLCDDLRDARAALAKALQAHMDPRACVAHQPLDTDTLGPCAYCETVQMAEERDALRMLLREVWAHHEASRRRVEGIEQEHVALAVRVTEALR